MRARVYVLAAGGIENARLLLTSDRVQPAGVGNGNDLVGRYFMEHLTVPGAVFLSSREGIVGDLYRTEPHRGIRRCAYLVPSPATQREERLLNMRSWLAEASHLDALRWTGHGIQAADALEEGLRRRQLGDLAGQIWRVISDLDDVAMYTYLTFLQPGRHLPAYHLITHIEQAPNPDSRVSLSEKRDELGRRRVKLDWKFGSLEKHSFSRGMELLGQELGLAGLGRVRIIPDNLELEGPRFRRGARGHTGWPPGVRGSYHHLGTTRMATDPRNGVVDENSRVHGIANLYVAGSSVFPTAGYTNPTLTIVALTLRLADHLKQQMVA